MKIYKDFTGNVVKYFACENKETLIEKYSALYKVHPKAVKLQEIKHTEDEILVDSFSKKKCTLKGRITQIRCTNEFVNSMHEEGYVNILYGTSLQASDYFDDSHLVVDCVHALNGKKYTFDISTLSYYDRENLRINKDKLLVFTGHGLSIVVVVSEPRLVWHHAEPALRLLSIDFEDDIERYTKNIEKAISNMRVFDAEMHRKEQELVRRTLHRLLRVWGEETFLYYTSGPLLNLKTGRAHGVVCDMTPIFEQYDEDEHEKYVDDCHFVENLSENPDFDFLRSEDGVNYYVNKSDTYEISYEELKCIFSKMRDARKYGKPETYSKIKSILDKWSIDRWGELGERRVFITESFKNEILAACPDDNGDGEVTVWQRLDNFGHKGEEKCLAVLCNAMYSTFVLV